MCININLTNIKHVFSAIQKGIYGSLHELGAQSVTQGLHFQNQYIDIILSFLLPPNIRLIKIKTYYGCCFLIISDLYSMSDWRWWKYLHVCSYPGLFCSRLFSVLLSLALVASYFLYASYMYILGVHFIFWRQCWALVLHDCCTSADNLQIICRYHRSLLLEWPKSYLKWHRHFVEYKFCKINK